MDYAFYSKGPKLPLAKAVKIDFRSFPPWEGEFWREEFAKLKLPANADPQGVYAYLTRQVCRRPGKLQFHVCRIQAAALLDQEAVYAALLDLFWILGEKGQSLKQRVVGWAQGRLDADRLAALQECLTGGLKVRQLPFSPRSALHSGMWGQEVNLPSRTVETRKDPLVAARLCLELGQLDQAQEILTEQLKAKPDCLEVKQALLEIYLATQNAEGFRQSYLWLEACGCLDESWQAVSQQFGRKV